MKVLLYSWIVLIGLGQLVVRGEFRQWTASDGRTLLAEFVRVAEGKVVIKRRTDGRQFTLPLDSLSAADQTWVQEQGATLQAAAEKSEANAASKNPLSELVTGRWERHESDGLEFRLYGERKLLRGSSGLGGEAKRYPLVIVLHGKNGDVMSPDKPWPADSFANAANYRERPSFVFAPQAPRDNETWSGKNGAAVIEIVEDLMKHLPIDEKRVYLTGYSMGAYGTFHLLATEPKRFAAAVPVAGGGNPSAVRAHRKVPVWVFHGEKDDVVDVEQSQRMVDAMKKARAPVVFTRDKDADHGIGGKVYEDVKMHEWLFQQTRK